MPPFILDSVRHRARCDPRDPAFYLDPYPFYAQLHTVCPRFVWEEYGHWCFAGWDDVNALLRDKRFGRQVLHVATRDELGWPPPLEHTTDFDAAERHSLLSLEPPEHTRLRTLVNRAFVSRKVESLRPEIESLANELIDSVEAAGEAELLRDFAAPLPVIVIAAMLGVPRHMAPQLLDWSNRMVRMYMFNRTRDTDMDSNRAARDFMAYLRTLAAEKRARPGDDLISYMIETEHRGQKLTEAELVSTAILLLNAGHEATVHQTGNAIKCLVERGNVSALFASPEQTAATVEECMRFDAPLHLFTRFALEDLDLGDGIRLKKGDEIGLMLGAANRDPSRFAAPGKFDPFRTDGAQVSFGAGIHFCIGAPLARLEMQIALKILFDRLPNLRLATPPKRRNVYHFNGLEELKACW